MLQLSDHRPRGFDFRLKPCLNFIHDRLTGSALGRGVQPRGTHLDGNRFATVHKEWIEGHVKNFHDFETEGRFQRAQKMMRIGLLLTAYGRAFQAACQKVRAEAVTQVERLSKDFLAETGHRLEAVKQPDGTFRFAYKQIWSDEEIRRKKQEGDEAILNALGRNLLEDTSDNARQLLAFLSAVYRANMSRDVETPKDVGVIWLACLEVINKDPDSEVAQAFKVLNDAWTATRSDNEA